MKKKLTILSLMFMCSFAINAQITVESCYEKAQANYPLIKQYGLIDKMKEYDLSNAAKGYLPQVLLSAKATYQSDVTQIPIDISKLGIKDMKMPVLTRDQYGASVDINQVIWDGGEIKSQKEGINIAAEVDKKGVDVNIYAINERVNQIYFGILLAEAQINQNQLLQDELKINYDQVCSYVQNGIANQVDLDVVSVEQLKAVQNNIQLTTTKKAYIEMLSYLIGDSLNIDSEFVKPDAIWPKKNQNNRPELALYDAQLKELEIKKRSITTGLMPKFDLFVTGGYGKPGMNMLNNNFSAYYIGGVKVSWNIGSFYTKKSMHNKIRTSINYVNIRRETFLFNTDITTTQIENNINSSFEQLKYDDKIIALRNSVKLASEVKMANGTLSSSDLMRDINAEQMAKYDKILHEMQLLLAIYNLKFTYNN